MLEQVKKLREEENSQEKKLKKIQYYNKLLENKLEQIVKEVSRLSVKKFKLGNKKSIQKRNNTKSTN